MHSSGTVQNQHIGCREANLEALRCRAHLRELKALWYACTGSASCDHIGLITAIVMKPSDSAFGAADHVTICTCLTLRFIASCAVPPDTNVVSLLPGDSTVAFTYSHDCACNFMPWDGWEAGACKIRNNESVLDVSSIHRTGTNDMLARD